MRDKPSLSPIGRHILTFTVCFLPLCQSAWVGQYSLTVLVSYVPEYLKGFQLRQPAVSTALHRMTGMTLPVVTVTLEGHWPSTLILCSSSVCVCVFLFTLHGEHLSSLFFFFSVPNSRLYIHSFLLFTEICIDLQHDIGLRYIT